MDEKKKKKKIALFGGTFDPIHLGHINLAIQAIEKCHIYQLYFVPAFISPYKQNNLPTASADHRLEMIKLATSSLPKSAISTYEIEKEAISYSVDTVSYFKQKFPNDDLYLLMTKDVAAGFSGWKEPEKILSMATPLVGERTTLDRDKKENFTWIEEKNFFTMDIMEISSSKIRSRIPKNQYVGHLLDAKVLAYIHKYRLYSI